MNHLYEDKTGIIHSCESATIIHNNSGTKLVWTKCGKDVPANQSFKSSHESASCSACICASDSGVK